MQQKTAFKPLRTVSFSLEMPLSTHYLTMVNFLPVNHPLDKVVKYRFLCFRSIYSAAKLIETPLNVLRTDPRVDCSDPRLRLVHHSVHGLEIPAFVACNLFDITPVLSGHGIMPLPFVSCNFCGPVDVSIEHYNQ